jgi:hypothetical protein
MSMMKKVRKGLLVSIVFLLTLMRTSVSKALPLLRPAPTLDHHQPRTLKSSQGLMVRWALPWRQIKPGQRRYALEIRGTFPYVRTTSFLARSVRMPVESGALSPAVVASEWSDLRALLPAQGANVIPQGDAQVNPFLISDCSSCLSCSSCGSCSSCTCSCGSCGGCGGCFACASCFSCCDCASCFSCASCVDCFSCCVPLID